jgi:DNA-directed RNA polymerase I, II, and III subunit RPABC3
MELIHDFFTIKEIDMVLSDSNKSSHKVKNKIFSKISRISASSKNNLLELFLDVNTEIYSVKTGEELDILIWKIPCSLSECEYQVCDWVDYFGKETLDLYEYVIYGTIFHSGTDKNICFVYASFGGLLLKLFGSMKENIFEEFKIDSKILLMIRKI